MAEVVLVRHGETEWSKAGRHTGRTDVPLTAEGRHQAERVGERLVGRRFALVLTSPLSRARETCNLAGPGDRAESCEELLEWDYGSYEGVTTEEIRRARPGWSVFSGGAPGGETLEQVGQRVDRVIARIRSSPGDVALFAHAHVLRVLTARWLGSSPRAGAISFSRQRRSACSDKSGRRRSCVSRMCDRDHENPVCGCGPVGARAIAALNRDDCGFTPQAITRRQLPRSTLLVNRCTVWPYP